MLSYASSPKDWSGDLVVRNVDCYRQWMFGRTKACELLKVDPAYFNPISGYSMLRPNKRMVGVTVDIERNEVSEEDIDTEDEDSPLSESENTEEDENLVSLDIEKFIEDNEVTVVDAKVEVSGKILHKASVIREIFNESENGSSNDRLRRVRSYTKYLSTDSGEIVDNDDDDLELDEMIMVGDLLCGKIALKDGKASFAVGKIASMKDMTDKKFKTVSPIAKIPDLQFQVKIGQANVIEDIVSFNQGWSSILMTWKGTHCALVDMPDLELEMDKAVRLMQSLPVADHQKVENSFLPYHSSLEVPLDLGETMKKIPCRLCGELLTKKLMRTHVEKHVLEDNLGIVCGFCGMGDCSVTLEVGSGRGKTVTLKPASNCEYVCKF